LEVRNRQIFTIFVLLKVETDPFSLRRYCGYFAILEVAILEEELIGLGHFWGIFLRLSLGIPEAGWLRGAVWEIDSDKGFIILWVEIAWVFVDVVDGAALPCSELLCLWVMSGFTL
jgi:hypothetical protein